MQPTGGDQREAAAPVERHARWGNAALLLTSLLATLLVIEIGYRLIAGVPVFKLGNWRTDRVITFNLGELKAIFDPVLGWTSRPSSVHEHGYTTIEHGIRKNFGETTPIRTAAAPRRVHRPGNRRFGEGRQAWQRCNRATLPARDRVSPGTERIIGPGFSSAHDPFPESGTMPCVSH